MGTVVTAWLPQRYPPGVLPHAIAYAAYLMEGTGAIPLSDAMARFTSSYFGSEDAELVSAIVRLAGIQSSRWDRYRYPDHPLKSGGGPNSLMWWLKEESHHTYAHTGLIELLETTVQSIARRP